MAREKAQCPVWKVCPTCGKRKRTRTGFYKDKQNRTGFRTNCIACLRTPKGKPVKAAKRRATGRPRTAKPKAAAPAATSAATG